MSQITSPIAPTRLRKRNNVSVKNPKWTCQDDLKLGELVAGNINPNWKAIGNQFPGKTTQQVFERWSKVLDPSLTKGSWTREEDETIIRFVHQYGTKMWSRLADYLPGRIGKQCRERWINHLNPQINHQPWSKEEDDKLTELHETFGNKWSKISHFLPSRTDNMIKNRWYSTLAKKVIPKDPSSPALPLALASPTSGFPGLISNSLSDLFPPLNQQSANNFGNNSGNVSQNVPMPSKFMLPPLSQISQVPSAPRVSQAPTPITQQSNFANISAVSLELVLPPLPKEKSSLVENRSKLMDLLLHH